MADEALPAVKTFLSLYTPSLEEPAVLEQILVGRSEIIQRIVGEVLHSVGTATKQHHLVVGPRGIGKTHLVSVLYPRLKSADQQGMQLAWLREDPWGIRSLDKLLIDISKVVAYERGQPPLARLTGETAAQLAPLTWCLA